MDSIPHASTDAAGADESERPCARLRPYEFIGTPPITLLLYAIAAHCRAGGCITPGVRLLADWASVSRGCVSPYLYELARDGWISYDGHVIMLLIDPDHADDQSDHADDRFATDHDHDRPFDRSAPIDHGRDRFESDMVLTTTALESDPVVVVVTGGGCKGGDSAAQAMSDLGANWKIVKDAFVSRADWTADQVRARWAYDQRRIAASDGKLNEGIFFAALRAGQLAPPRPDPDRPIPVEAYAGDPGFVLGSQAPPGDDAPEPIGDIARRILPADASTAEWVFVQSRLARGDSEAGALEALLARKAVRR